MNAIHLGCPLSITTRWLTPVTMMLTVPTLTGLITAHAWKGTLDKVNIAQVRFLEFQVFAHLSIAIEEDNTRQKQIWRLPESFSGYVMLNPIVKLFYWSIFYDVN